MDEKEFRLCRFIARTGLALAWVIVLVAPLSRVQAASTLYVNGVSGNDANLCTYSQPCQSITRGIAVAASGDTIRISPDVYNENLVVGKDLTLIGNDAQHTIVDGQMAGAVIRITGTPGDQPQVHLEKMAFRNGTIGVRVQDAHVNLSEAVVSGNIPDSSEGKTGGGIKCLSGRVNVVDTTVTNNQADTAAGVWVNSGCTFSMANSTVYLNQGVYAAGLQVLGTASLMNVTISSNQATVFPPVPKHPGGLKVETGGSATLNHCTIAKNQAIYATDGWQIWAEGTVYLKNTIVQGGSQAGEPNCQGSSNIISVGYNLSSDATCNLVGTGDLPNTPAQLYALAANGGPTYTHGLPSTSPAVDAAGPPDPDTPTYDQRGLAHCDGNFDGIIQGDIGAFEYQPLKFWLPLTRR